MQNISRIQLFLLISVACGTTGITLFITLFGAFNHSTLFSKQEDAPSLQGNYNSNLKIEVVAEGLFSPTSMAFLDDHKILVLEKNTGLVRLISDGVLQDKPVLKLSIDAKGERGLLGIAVMHKNDNKTGAVNTEVFLYLTTKSMNNNRSTISNDDQLRNRISKYEWNGQTLVLMRLLKERLDMRRASAIEKINIAALCSLQLVTPDSYTAALLGLML